MRISKALAAEIRHRVGFHPNHVIQEPVGQVLQRRADTIDVVIAADNPKGTVFFKHASRSGQPCIREPVVFAKTVELVPLLFHPVDPGIVRSMQITR